MIQKKTISTKKCKTNKKVHGNKVLFPDAETTNSKFENTCLPKYMWFQRKRHIIVECQTKLFPDKVQANIKLACVTKIL